MREYAEALAPVMKLKPKSLYQAKRDTLENLPDGRCVWGCSCERCFENPQRKETWKEYQARTQEPPNKQKVLDYSSGGT